MKRLILIFLITLLSTPVLLKGHKIVAAQDPPKQEKFSALEAYAKWRNNVQEQNGGNIPSHCAMSAVSQRIDEKSARIEFAIVGQLPAYAVEIKPVYIRPGSTHQSDHIVAGETMSMQFRPAKSGYTNLNEPVAIIPVDSTANAVEIKWLVDNPEVRKISTTLIMPLQSARRASVYGLIHHPKKSTMNHNGKVSYRFVKSLKTTQDEEDCVTIKAECSGSCGTMEKKCKDTIGNVINCVNCSITCGTACPGEIE